MFYCFDTAVAAANDADNKSEVEVHLAAGVIHQVDVLFQTGSSHHIHVQIWQANRQLWPSNRGETMRGNATVISFREFFELPPGNQLLTIIAWNDDSATETEVLVQIGLLPRKILQPLSFENLLEAAAGMEP